MNGPTKKQIAAGQRRTLAAMARKLRDMAANWGDVDGLHINVTAWIDLPQAFDPAATTRSSK